MKPEEIERYTRMVGFTSAPPIFQELFMLATRGMTPTTIELDVDGREHDLQFRFARGRHHVFAATTGQTPNTASIEFQYGGLRLTAHVEIRYNTSAREIWTRLKEGLALPWDNTTVVDFAGSGYSAWRNGMVRTAYLKPRSVGFQIPTGLWRILLRDGEDAILAVRDELLARGSPAGEYLSLCLRIKEMERARQALENRLPGDVKMEGNPIADFA